jgi:hypothetical protein
MGNACEGGAVVWVQRWGISSLVMKITALEAEGEESSASGMNNMLLYEGLH